MNLKELEDKLSLLVEAQVENYPRKTSDRFFSGDTDDVLAGTQLTITWTLSAQWVTRIIECYADVRTGWEYLWIINGRVYTINQVRFHMGRPVTGMQIQLVMRNPTATDDYSSYYIMGWGDHKGES